MEKKAFNGQLQIIEKKPLLEVVTAQAMPGFESVPLDGLVVATNSLIPWDRVKQDIIPLAPADSNTPSARKAATELKMNRAAILDTDAFFVLVKDSTYGDNGGWSLSMIRPKNLMRTEV